VILASVAFVTIHSRHRLQTDIQHIMTIAKLNAIAMFDYKLTQAERSFRSKLLHAYRSLLVCVLTVQGRSLSSNSAQIESPYMI